MVRRQNSRYQQQNIDLPDRGPGKKNVVLHYLLR